MAPDKNKNIFFSNLARISEQVMKGEINEQNAIEKLSGIFQDYYNAYEMPLFDFVKKPAFMQFIAPLNFYFDKNSNVAGFYQISNNTNNVNVGSVFADNAFTTDPLTNIFINLFDGFSTIAHETRHNRQSFPFLASLQQNSNLHTLYKKVAQFHPFLSELKKILNKKGRSKFSSRPTIKTSSMQSDWEFASDFMQQLPILKTKQNIVQYILNYINVQSIDSLDAKIKNVIEQFADTVEAFLKANNSLEDDIKTFSNALGKNGENITKATQDFYNGKRIHHNTIKEIIEGSYNITPTLWEENILHLTEQDLEELTNVWYQDNLMERDARETETSSLHTLLADLEQYIATTQSEEEKIILAPAVDAIKYQIELKKLLEEQNYQNRDEYLPLVDKVINPEKMLADLIATGREALKAEYTQEFLNKNGAFAGEFAGIKATKESQLVSSILNIVQNYNEIYHMSIQDFHLLLIQHGFIDSAQMLARCYNEENQGGLYLETDDYYNLLMTKPITLNSLCYVDRLSTEQLSSVVEHFIKQGQLLYVEKIVELCNEKSGNPIEYIFKPEQVRKANTISSEASRTEDYIKIWAADSCLQELAKCKDTYKALKGYAIKLANTPIDKLSFDEVDGALSALHSIAKILGFEEYLKNQTQPPESEQDAINFLNIYNNLETIARIKLTDTHSNFDHTTLGYACPEDRKKYRGSTEQHSNYINRVYGKLESDRQKIRKEAFTRFSSEGYYTDEYEHE